MQKKKYFSVVIHNVWTTNYVSAGDLPRRVSGKIDYLAAKQQILWVVITFASLSFDQGVPKKLPTTAPSSRSEHHLTVFYIDQIVPGFVVYYLNRLEIELNLVYFLIGLPAAGSLAVTSLSDFTVHGVAYKESSYLRRRCL